MLRECSCARELQRGLELQGGGAGRVKVAWVGAGEGWAAASGGLGRLRVPEASRSHAHVDREGRDQMPAPLYSESPLFKGH